MDKSTWFYMKIYANPRVANIVFRDAVAPLAEELIARDHCRRWFFVRYADPEPHFRVRWNLSRSYTRARIREKLASTLKPFVENHHVWSLKEGIYEPEFERYGPNNMDTVHTIFYQQSLMALKLHSKGYTQKERLLISCFLIDWFLEHLDFSMLEKKCFVQTQRNYFTPEFEVGPIQKKRISLEYRQVSAILLDFKNTPLFKSISQDRCFMKAMEQTCGLLSQLSFKGTSLNLDTVLASLFHMMVNKFFIYDQRAIEFVIYEFLNRGYRSRMALKQYGTS